jgi:seryl-tRNA synthetase
LSKPVIADATPARKSALTCLAQAYDIDEPKRRQQGPRHAPFPLFPSRSQGEPRRSADRLAPADAARGHDQAAAAGIYSWLPLGYKVLRNLERIVHEEQMRAGHIPMLMPTLQSADLWRESGRFDDYGQEMLRIKDRHERDMLYGPTNEEMITDIFRAHVGSATRTCR